MIKIKVKETKKLGEVINNNYNCIKNNNSKNSRETCHTILTLVNQPLKVLCIATAAARASRCLAIRTLASLPLTIFCTHIAEGSVKG
jgi:hypothetical protein